MNEQLQGALTSLINKSLAGLDAATDVLTAELPEVITQLMLWYSVKSAITSIICIFILYLIYKFTSWQYKKFNDADLEFWDHPELMFNLLLLIPIMISLKVMNLDWLQIWIAPKVWLIEYAASLAK